MASEQAVLMNHLPESHTKVRWQDVDKLAIKGIESGPPAPLDMDGIRLRSRQNACRES